MTTKKRNHGRSPGQTATSISLPDSLHAELKQWAKQNERTVSAQIRHVLNDAAREWKARRGVDSVTDAELSRRR